VRRCQTGDVAVGAEDRQIVEGCDPGASSNVLRAVLVAGQHSDSLVAIITANGARHDRE
jgi:hypothetical protein